MNIFISTKNNSIYASKLQNNIRCFTEYGLHYKNINVKKLEEMPIVSTVDSLLLLPFTHINNIWHLIHQLFIAYKYIKINKIATDNIFFIFFPTFYERQGDILNSTYNELIFTGLGFSFEKFKNTYKIFSKNKAISVNKLYIVNQNLNFINQPLFEDFKNNIINNFNIKRTLNEKRITFILRRGTREITNLDFVKNELRDMNIRYVYFEDHPIKKQLEIAANTDILIGMHGAGLAWLIFMKKKSLLIEMYPGNSNTDNYIRWCNIAGINYKRLTINITSGNVKNFRNCKVNLNDEQINILKNIIKI